MHLFLDSDVLPPQAPRKHKGGDTDADAEVHDVADGLGVALERGGQPAALDEFSDRVGPGGEDKVRVDADLGITALELLAQAVAEDGVGGHEPDGAAHVLSEDDDSHGDWNLWRGDQVLHGYVGLI